MNFLGEVTSAASPVEEDASNSALFDRPSTIRVDDSFPESLQVPDFANILER